MTAFQEIQKLRADTKAFEGFWDRYREMHREGGR